MFVDLIDPEYEYDRKKRGFQLLGGPINNTVFYFNICFSFSLKFGLEKQSVLWSRILKIIWVIESGCRKYLAHQRFNLWF